MLVVLLQDYDEKSPERRAEYDACIRANLEHPAVSAVLNVSEGSYRNPAFVTHPKMRFEPQEARLTFGEATRLATALLEPGTVVVLVNLDVHVFGDGWHGAEAEVTERIALCLGRHETLHTGERVPNAQLAALAHANAQDAWAWRVPIVLDDAEFHLGATGCDNAVAHRFAQAGRQPRNPMFAFPVAHVDASARDQAYRRRTERNLLREQPETRGCYLVPAMGPDGTYAEAVQALLARVDPRVQERIAHELYNRLIKIKN